MFTAQGHRDKPSVLTKYPGGSSVIQKAWASPVGPALD